MLDLIRMKLILSTWDLLGEKWFIRMALCLVLLLAFIFARITTPKLTFDKFIQIIVSVACVL